MSRSASTIVLGLVSTFVAGYGVVAHSFSPVVAQSSSQFAKEDTLDKNDGGRLEKGDGERLAKDNDLAKQSDLGGQLLF